MNNWKVIFATVVIFGAGVITGGLLVNYVNLSHIKPGRRAAAVADAHGSATNPAARSADLPKLRPPEILDKDFLTKIDDVLHLSTKQSLAIKQIIADGQAQNHTIWTNSTAEMRKVMQDSRHQISEQLTPEQQKEFENMLKQFRTPRRPANSTNTVPASALSPEAQIMLIESNRLRALGSSR